MKNVCQKCGAYSSRSAGHCPVCGGVCLRSEPWTPYADNSAASTPLFQTRIPGLKGTWLKVEGANLSGSFKDRIMQVLVREAVQDGAHGAIVASSGNAAVAAASHCARANLPLLVIVPEQVPEQILAMVRHRGATVLQAGEGPAAVHHLAKLISEKFGLPNLASTFGASGCEWACRSIGHEIDWQLPQQEVLTLAAAVSVGPVLLGAAHGLQESGRSIPRMIAGQAAGCSPIAKAFSHGWSEVQPWVDPVDTRATSISDRLTGYYSEATFFLNELKASGGAVEAADDMELQEIRNKLARYDGLDVELSSCAAVAALIHSGFGGPETVCVLTGAGVRETLSSSAQFPEPPSIEEFFSSVIGDSTVVKEIEKWIHEYRS